MGLVTLQACLWACMRTLKLNEMSLCAVGLQGCMTCSRQRPAGVKEAKPGIMRVWIAHESSVQSLTWQHPMPTS